MSKTVGDFMIARLAARLLCGIRGVARPHISLEQARMFTRAAVRDADALGFSPHGIPNRIDISY